jgi:hypothetical protein
MARTKPKQAELLAKLFDESEKSRLSDRELNLELKGINIDPEALVDAGLQIVEKFKSRLVGGTFSLPMAAASNTKDLTKDELSRLLDGGKKPKKR